MPDLPGLIKVMEEVRARLTDPAADFSWSPWARSEHALYEIDSFLHALRDGRIPTSLLRELFAPTGPIQRVAIRSG